MFESGGSVKSALLRAFSLGETEVEALVRKCRAGDSDAWAALIEHFKGLVYSIPRQLGLGEDDCADVFQYTFQALLRNLDRIETPQNLSRWLAVTASREGLRLRRLAERGPTMGDVATLEEVLDEEDQGAEVHALQGLQTEEIHQSLAMIPDRCRELLKMLFFEEELPYNEISSRARIPIGAIGPTRARCLEKLRRVLMDRGFFS
jgi:RNA polymerase sigma factor (sigma-70 family)